MTSQRSSAAPFPGAIRQISFVVADIDRAMQEWLALGVGPWFVLRRFCAEGSLYRGTASSPTISLAFANSGDLQIELVATEDETPSIYREFLDAGRQGFHHIAYWASDVSAASERAAERGWTSVQSGTLPFHYYEVSESLGLVVEVSSLNSRMASISEAIRAAALGWDGLDRPIRDYPPTSTEGPPVSGTTG